MLNLIVCIVQLLILFKVVINELCLEDKFSTLYASFVSLFRLSPFIHWIALSAAFGFPKIKKKDQS